MTYTKTSLTILSLGLLTSLIIPAQVFAATTITVDAPADGTLVNDADTVDWTWDTAATDGQITFALNSGVDPNAPHMYTMTGTELDAGSHSILISTLNADPGFSTGGSLVDGAVYDITVDSPTDAITDTATSITYDTSSPTIVLSTTASNPTGVSPIPITATFSEPVTGFADTDVVVTNGVVSNFAGGPTVYTFDVTPAANGLVTVDVPAAVAQDLAGNDNTVSNTVSLTFDSDQPTVILSSSLSGETRQSTIPMTATFSEDVTGFADTDIIVSNGNVVNFVAISPTTYTFDIQVIEEGTVTAQVPVAVAQDVALNDNLASNLFSIFFDVPNSNSCSGDCYHPHFGIDQNNKVFYDDGLTIDNSLIYRIDNVLHNPYAELSLDVGIPVTFKMKAMDNHWSQIRSMELALSIPKGHFDKQQAQIIIHNDIDFLGNSVISNEGDPNLIEKVASSITHDDKSITWTFTFIPKQKLNHDMFALSVVDEYNYPGTYYINEGFHIYGISMNGTPVFDYLDDDGRLHTLTIVDKTLEDMKVAIDEQGRTWTLEGTNWMREFVMPDMTCYTTDRTCYSGHKALLLEEQVKARSYFDSAKIQGYLEPSKTIDMTQYSRGETRPQSNFDDLVKELLSKPGIVNHSSYKLD